MISPRICIRSFASRLERGSSMRNVCGRRMSARPSATRCCCPPESWRGSRSIIGVRPSTSAISLTRRVRSSRGTPRIRSGNSMFPRTLFDG